jgi:preprotein translocase subunit SecF
VLTIGMAVDANVLVFERIREELRHAKNPARAIELGLRAALSAIMDANITTFITAWCCSAGCRGRCAASRSRWGSGSSPRSSRRSS